ncbi:MAG: dTMP kinase [Thermodesulfobacteriota bacterium]
MGFFITFEGIEGCGKTTQAEMLKDYFEWKGREVVSVREPGGTELGERVRAILVSVEGEGLDYWAELFLYEACRAQLVKDVIKPSLEEGKIVICDRYKDSTLGYQGYGRGLDMGAVTSVNEWASAGVEPNLTFLMDCSPEEGLKRAWHRIGSAELKEDRFEKEAVEFHASVRKGFLELAGKEPQRIRVVKGEGEIEAIHKEICGIIEKAGV